MPGFFLDSSALAKLYHPERGSDQVERLFEQPDCQILISRLTVVEVQSVLVGKVRAGMIGEDDVEAVRKRFFGDIGGRLIDVAAVGEPHFETAGDLIRRHATTRRLRTLDALQLAVALDLRSRAVLDHFVAADKVLCAVAASEGVSAINPED